MESSTLRPRVGVGYRAALLDWIASSLDQIETLEITLDHYFLGTDQQRDRIEGLTGTVPLTGHGVGLSLGTDILPDGAYLEKVAQAVDRLGLAFYSEHLAFTGVPGYELANLLPLPKTEAVAEIMVRNVNYVRSFLDVPFLLENITYYFEYPDSSMTDSEFMNVVCSESGADMLLDVENVYVNAVNGFCGAVEYLDALPPSSVMALHTAGCRSYEGLLVDTHDQPVPDGTIEILEMALQRFSPMTVILERDRRLNELNEIAHDLQRIKNCVETIDAKSAA